MRESAMDSFIVVANDKLAAYADRLCYPVSSEEMGHHAHTGLEEPGIRRAI